MKVYPTLNVQLSYHNFGSAWLMILKGSTEEIDLAFNGLFNLCATNGSYEFRDHLKTVAVFWSDESSMERFFFNQFFLPRCTTRKKKEKTDGAYPSAVSFATNQMGQLRLCHEFFLDFNNRFVPDTYTNGKISAERLDTDMKDAILAHAFTDKSSTTQCNEQTEIR